MKRRRKGKGPSAQPGLAKQHLVKYSNVPSSPQDIKNGHILHLYITSENSRTATARKIIKHIPEITENQAKSKVKLLVEKSLTKFKKLTDEREFEQFEHLCSQKFSFSPQFPTTTTTVPQARSPSKSPIIIQIQSTSKAIHPETRQLARTTCPSCVHYKYSLKAMRQKHQSKNLEIKTLKAKQKKQGAVRIINQKLKRKEKQISHLKHLLESEDLETLSKLKEQYKMKTRNHMRLKQSLTHLRQKVRSNSVHYERCCELEERTAKMDSEIHDLQAENLLLEEKIHDLESENYKKYTQQMRLMVFDAISNQVPTANIPNLITKFGLRFNINLSDVPSRATVEAMARELGAISDLQAAEALLTHAHCALGFDATTQEEIHLNSIHFTTKDNCYVVAVDELPGCSAEDYQIHICDSISNLAKVYCHFFEANYKVILKKLISNISNTLTEHCAANHAAIRLVCSAWNKTLYELNCNLHPLETIASKTKMALKEVEKALGISGKIKGKECIGANIVVQVNKMRYMDGKGDPRGFKTFLNDQNLPLGLIPRYRGNRLHIMFHIAGILVCYHDALKSYLSGGPSCGGLRASILDDFNSITGQVELHVLGLLGKFLTGPWMRKFYTGADDQTDYHRGIDLIKEAVQNMKQQLHAPGEFLSRKTNFFGDELDASDGILQKLQQPPKDAAMFTQMIEGCLKAAISVLERQYQTYFANTWTVSDKLQEETTSARRPHNMDAEELIGMFSALKKKAPNVTICYLSCKMRARKNNTIEYLDTLHRAKQELVIRKAVRLGAMQRRRRRKKQGELQEELHRCQVSRERKRTEHERKVLEGKLEELGEERIAEAFPELPEEKLYIIKELLGGRGVGAFICHAWDLGGNRVVFNGKIEKFDGRKKKYTIGYWAMSGEEYDFDAHDTDVSVYAMAADIILDDLVIQ